MSTRSPRRSTSSRAASRSSSAARRCGSRAGDAFVAPAGIAHAHRAEAGATSYLAVSFVQSVDLYESFLAAVAHPEPGGPPDAARVRPGRRDARRRQRDHRARPTGRPARRLAGGLSVPGRRRGQPPAPRVYCHSHEEALRRSSPAALFLATLLMGMAQNDGCLPWQESVGTGGSPFSGTEDRASLAERGRRSGAGVEPTEPRATRGHWFEDQLGHRAHPADAHAR